MTENHRHNSEWSGLLGKFHAWFFNTHSRKILELLFFGNYWPAFKKERSKRIKTGSESVLDIGAGSGNFSIPIAKRLNDGKIFCLDISVEMTDFLVKVAKKNHLQNKIQILNEDAAATTLESESIDWVVSGNCLHEMVDPKAVFAEMFRVLKPTGTVFLVDFRDWHGYHEGAHGPYSLEQMNEFLRQAGFTDISLEPHRHFVTAIAVKR